MASTSMRRALARSAAVPEALLAYSCDKNFGLYRERTGALFAIVPDADAGTVVLSNLLALARANWSMPPDHGAAIVRIILEDEALTREWRDELEAMRARLAGLRARLAEGGRIGAVDLARSRMARACSPLCRYRPPKLNGCAIGMVSIWPVRVVSTLPGSTPPPLADSMMRCGIWRRMGWCKPAWRHPALLPGLGLGRK